MGVNEMKVLFIQPSKFINDDIVVFFSGSLIKIDSIEKLTGMNKYETHMIIGTEYTDRGEIKHSKYFIGTKYHLVIRS